MTGIKQILLVIEANTIYGELFLCSQSKNRTTGQGYKKDS